VRSGVSAAPSAALPEPGVAACPRRGPTSRTHHAAARSTMSRAPPSVCVCVVLHLHAERAAATDEVLDVLIVHERLRRATSAAGGVPGGSSSVGPRTCCRRLICSTDPGLILFMSVQSTTPVFRSCRGTEQWRRCQAERIRGQSDSHLVKVLDFEANDVGDPSDRARVGDTARAHTNNEQRAPKPHYVGFLGQLVTRPVRGCDGRGVRLHRRATKCTRARLRTGDKRRRRGGRAPARRWRVVGGASGSSGAGRHVRPAHLAHGGAQHGRHLRRTSAGASKGAAGARDACLAGVGHSRRRPTALGTHTAAVSGAASRAVVRGRADVPRRRLSGVHGIPEAFESQAFLLVCAAHAKVWPIANALQTP
jgi:hypothetical protein